MSATPTVLIVKWKVTLDQIRKELEAQGKGAMVFYGAMTCWWTHTPDQLWKTADKGNGISLPADSRGGVLLQADNWRGFLDAAEQGAKDGHYGKHGIMAFLASHNLNSWCEYAPESDTAKLQTLEAKILALEGKEPPEPILRPWCEGNWQAYNDAIDRMTQEEAV